MKTAPVSCTLQRLRRHARIALVLALAALAGLTGCSDDVPADAVLLSSFPSPLPEIFKNDSSAFRGIKLGMSRQEVKTRCNAKTLTLDESLSLLYEDSLPGKTSFTFEFSFDSLGLSIVQVDIYQRGSADGDSLQQRISRFFTQLHGSPNQVKDNWQWLPQGQIRPTAIVLQDESAEYGYGKVSLLFYDTNITDMPLLDEDGFEGNPDSLAGDSMLVF